MVIAPSGTWTGTVKLLSLIDGGVTMLPLIELFDAKSGLSLYESVVARLPNRYVRPQIYSRIRLQML